MLNPSGKRVLVTGGARGIGFCIAQEFASRGSEVILVDLRSDELEAAAKELSLTGATIDTRVCDITDREAVGQTAQWLRKTLGSLDVLINNAGIAHLGELQDTSMDTWKRLMDVNLWGQLYFIEAMLPSMIAGGGGHIANVSSGQAFFKLPSWGAYAATKTAFGVYSEVLQVELKRHNIKVTTVYPFMVNTGLYNNVDTPTLGSRLAMKLVPLYSMKPSSVGRIVYKAVCKGKKVEMVSILNNMGQVASVLPFVSGLIGNATHWFLARTRSTQRAPELKESSKGLLLARVRHAVGALMDGNFGFRIDEIMSGHHEFHPDMGPPGKRVLEYRVSWGPRDIASWLDPSGSGFMQQPLAGTIRVEGLCETTPCQGTLTIDYFNERKIRYDMDFLVDDVVYRLVGEKVNIRPWNLPVSHTTCYGTLTQKDTGKLVSTSVTHFRLRTLPAFATSFRVELQSPQAESAPSIQLRAA